MTKIERLYPNRFILNEVRFQRFKFKTKLKSHLYLFFTETFINSLVERTFLGKCQFSTESKSRDQFSQTRSFENQSD